MITKGRNATIRELVDRIVDTHGKRGEAVFRLNQLHDTLEDELEATTDEQEKTRLEHDLEFLEGYQETPAALLADLKARPLHRARSRR